MKFTFIFYIFSDIININKNYNHNHNKITFKLKDKKQLVK